MDDNCLPFPCDQCGALVCYNDECEIHCPPWEVGFVNTRIGCSEECWFKMSEPCEHMLNLISNMAPLELIVESQPSEVFLDCYKCNHELRVDSHISNEGIS